jgi:hypothetical protein
MGIGSHGVDVAETILVLVDVAAVVFVGTTVCVPVPVACGVSVLLGTDVGVFVAAPPGVSVAVGDPHTLLVNTILELAVAVFPHTHCVNPPAPFCTPIVAVPPVLIAPITISNPSTASYSLISKYAFPGFEK